MIRDGIVDSVIKELHLNSCQPFKGKDNYDEKYALLVKILEKIATGKIKSIDMCPERAESTLLLFKYLDGKLEFRR